MITVFESLGEPLVSGAVRPPVGVMELFPSAGVQLSQSDPPRLPPFQGIGEDATSGMGSGEGLGPKFFGAATPVPRLTKGPRPLVNRKASLWGPGFGEKSGLKGTNASPRLTFLWPRGLEERPDARVQSYSKAQSHSMGRDRGHSREWKRAGR
jgi:hypothetical protein